MTHPHLERVARAERIAQRMDNAFRLPLTRITIGWDSIIGLVPGIGDALALLPGLYIVQSAQAVGAPKRLVGRMGANLALDWVIGLLPLIGDVFDIGFKANLRNAALLRAHVEAALAPVGHGVPDRRPLAHNGAPPAPDDTPGRRRDALA